MLGSGSHLVVQIIMKHHFLDVKLDTEVMINN